MRKNSIKENLTFFLFCLPMLIVVAVICYLPMFGVIVAFKRYRYDLGIFGSPWVGLDNFKFFFNTPDAMRITVNTVGYNLIFIVVGLITAIMVALLLYEIKNRNAVKFYQTTMLIPHFLSWVVVAFVLYAFLNPRVGVVNVALKSMGMDTIDWYTKPEKWPYVIVVLNIWKNVGMSCVLYYACLMGIDTEYFDAAKLDGANKFQVYANIMIPFLQPIMIITTILAVGKIFSSDFGLFYQLPMGSPMLYSTTDVLDTYILRALKDNGNFGMAAAADFYKSFVGLILVLITNFIVKKYSPENSIF